MAAPPACSMHKSCRRAFLPANSSARSVCTSAADPLHGHLCCSSNSRHQHISRRDALQAALILSVPAHVLLNCQQADASKLGPNVDKAWESFGGGPSDLFFPEEFEGLWQVQSTLTGVEFPFGEKYVPDIRTANRALQEDYQRQINYSLSFRRNPQGRVVLDRQYNTAAILSHYYGSFESIMRNVRWDSSDPNELSVQLPTGGGMQARVTRRSREAPDSWRIETSEFYRQTFSNPDGAMSRVKASQCFTKYKFRSREQAGSGPQIVATQVVSDFLTSMDDQTAYMKTMNKPVVTYTYKMTFVRQKGGRDDMAVGRNAGLQEQHV